MISTYKIIKKAAYTSVAGALIFLVTPVSGNNKTDDLTELSLESLMDIEITSVAKRSQKVSDAAASVYVITSEDIHRSGATSIPEALRLAPGVEIAYIDSNKVAMSIRGFNGASSSNKLLVLIDGRTVYTTLVSGVFWDHQDIMLADIDRIEVIRGPGGTLWGANAVNGVINIITKHASDTTGGLVEGYAGTDPYTGQAALRYGGKLGDDAHYRVYGKYLDRGEFRLENGDDAMDDRQATQLGGRLDWNITDRDSVTLQGDIHQADFRQEVINQPVELLPPTFFTSNITTFRDSGDIRGGNALLRWTRQLDGNDNFNLQLYYDRFDREDSVAAHTTDTWDIDFQHQKKLTSKLNMLWGLGYRHIRYDFDNSRSILQLNPSGGKLNTYSAFIQGDYDITDKLRLTLGSKFEHNEFTGFEIQPSVRMRWQPHEYHTVWAAISRAVRTPSVFENGGRTDTFIIPGVPALLIPDLLFSTFGNRQLDAEELLAYEAGYREQLTDKLSIDITVFYNDYNNLVSSEFDPNPAIMPGTLLFSTNLDNKMTGESYGGEAVLEWRPTDFWRLAAGYSLVKMNLHRDKASQDLFSEIFMEGSSPQQQFQLRSYLDLSHNVQFDTTLYMVDQLPGQGPSIDQYLRLDFHLGWQPVKDISLDLFLQNILEDQHPEFGGGTVINSQVPRAVFGRVRWNW